MIDAAEEQVLTGQSVSGGIALGTLRVIRQAANRSRECGDPAHEKAEFARVIARAREELERFIAGQDELAGGILEFQLALLDDDDLLAPAFAAIAAGTPWHTAWSDLIDGEVAEYRKDSDDYLAARADDLADLKERVLSSVCGDAQAAQAEEGDILVFDELTPSRFLEQNWERLAGAAVRNGSPTSHVAILARARGVNLMVGLSADLTALHTGVPAILDSEQGRLVVSPSETSLRQAQERRTRLEVDRTAEAGLLHKEAVTADGTRVQVLINVDDPSLLDGLDPEICDGIGLTRTEFLFQGGALPDEDTQLAAYRRIIAWARGRPVTIRTLDAGGDKPLPGITVDGEANPFLGIRGVRLSLRQPDIFATQLRALARAALEGPLKIMIPMVTVPSELQECRRIMADALRDLDARSAAYGAPSLGMMVEVPAAALTAELFDSDFFSIGSNDLTQYTCAAARDNFEVANLADGTNPAVLELIRRTVEAGTRLDRQVSLCGDMASWPHLVATLLAQGLRTLSVPPATVGAVKLAVSRTRLDG